MPTENFMLAGSSKARTCLHACFSGLTKKIPLQSCKIRQSLARRLLYPQSCSAQPGQWAALCKRDIHQIQMMLDHGDQPDAAMSKRHWRTPSTTQRTPGARAAARRARRRRCAARGRRRRSDARRAPARASRPGVPRRAAGAAAYLPPPGSPAACRTRAAGTARPWGCPRT